MKKKLITLVCSAFTLMLIFCGCAGSISSANTTTTDATTSEKPSKCEFAILDYKTNEELTHFSLTEKERAITVANTVNYVEDIANPPTCDPTYIIHIIDTDNSKYDAWFNIYIFDNQLFSQWDTDKTQYNELNISSKIKLSTISIEEFLSVIK